MNPAIRMSMAVVLLCTATAGAAAVCTVSTGSVAFGAYSPITGGSRDSVGSVDVSCSALILSTVSYGIALSAGTGTFATRHMASGAHSLNYNLFKDSARSLVWGDGTSGTATVSDSYTIILSPTTRSYPVYGRIPGGQTGAHVGTYTDSITVTVTF